ncbi:MAG: hypothetical protein AB8G86_09335 [Saprospiraceae bacterium]
MKHYKRLHLGILCLFVSLLVLQAQEDGFFVFHAPENTIDKKQNQQTPYVLQKTIRYRHHKKLSVTHSGIVLELITSDLPLKRDFKLFQQFGNIYYDVLNGGGYAYCILTNFNKLKKAKAYLQQMILPHAPTAKVVKYQLGRRKKIVQ